MPQGQIRFKRGELDALSGGDSKLRRRIRRAREIEKDPEAFRQRSARYIRKPYGRLAMAKNSARKRGYVWALTREQFLEIISKPCYYCDGSLPETGAGIDRADNTKGYVVDNCLPCCKECNRIKGNQYSVEETIAIVGLIKKLRACA